MSETRILRDRFLNMADALDRANDLGGMQGAGAMLVVTGTQNSYPTAPASFFACRSCWIGGSPISEGASGGIQQSDTVTWIYAFNLGGAVPPSGTYLVVHMVGGRWVFRYDGAV
jgi:hypothetical protein